MKTQSYCAKNKFTPEEDQIILSVAKVGEDNDWTSISKMLQNKTARQCKDRWNNYLNPHLSIEEWKPDDDDLLLEKYIEYGPRWKAFLKLFPNRSINNIRNRCMKLIRMQEYSVDNHCFDYQSETKDDEDEKEECLSSEESPLKNEPEPPKLLIEKVEDIHNFDIFETWDFDFDLIVDWKKD